MLLLAYLDDWLLSNLDPRVLREHLGWHLHLLNSSAVLPGKSSTGMQFLYEIFAVVLTVLLSTSGNYLNEKIPLRLHSPGSPILGV